MRTFCHYIFLILILNNLKVEGLTITNPSQSDGFGSQFQSIIAAVVLAELKGYKFVYTPFRHMEHNYQNDKDFITKKELLINFINNFELNPGNISSPHINFKAYFDKHITTCGSSAALKKIKAIFRANKDVKNHFKNNRFNIAIHIRRPNPHDNRILGTDTPDQLFLTIIEKLRARYQKERPLMHLFSQGNIDNFKKFIAPDIILHIDETLEETFTSMVLADVLVISPSSFSYPAGLLSEGTIYYVPFWHQPLPHWISVYDL